MNRHSFLLVTVVLLRFSLAAAQTGRVNAQAAKAPTVETFELKELGGSAEILA